MTATVEDVTLPDGRTMAEGQEFRIKGERGVYRASGESCDGSGVWAYGGSRDPRGRRQWRCVAPGRVGAFVKTPKGHRA